MKNATPRIIIESNQHRAIRDGFGNVTGGFVMAWRVNGKKKGAAVPVKGCHWSGNLGEDAATATVEAQVSALFDCWYEVARDESGDIAQYRAFGANSSADEWQKI